MQPSPKRLTLILILLLLLIIPVSIYQPAGASTLWIVLADANFQSGPPGFDDAAIQKVLERVKSPLAAYQESVGSDTFSAARAIYTASISQEDTLNPQVLLAILHAEGRLQDRGKSPFILLLQGKSERLWEGYRAYLSGAQELTLTGGQVIRAGEETNAATYALAYYYAPQKADAKELQNALERWLQSYLFLFNQDPGLDIVTVQSVPDIAPFLQLPFRQPDTNFLRVNSFFDHVGPGTSFDDTLLRFDGKEFTGAHFNTCVIGVNCYGGHNGIDYSTGAGMPMLAAASGKVVYRYYNTDPSKGSVDSGLIIDHGNGYRTSYWHMDPIQVNINDNITQGQQIGLSGNIGKSSGAHLHFGLRLTSSNKSVDPYGWWSLTSNVGSDSRWMWAGDLVADNREAQAQLFYRGSWWREPVGYAGESYYTFSVDTTSKSTNWAIWGAYVPSAATYNVFAYWPKNAASTRSARYQIFHAGGSSIVTADQSSGGDEFVLLGSFSMARGPAAVILTDLTGDSGQRVYFDAIKWALKSMYPPTDLKLSKTSVNESVPVGTQVGTLSTTDADIGDEHTYALVDGEGSSDNASFRISGNRLLTAVALDYEAKTSYTIRLRTTDTGGAFFEKAFTIRVLDVNEAPSSLTLTGNSLQENLPAGTTVGTLSTTDQDAGDTHTYSLVSGTGSTDNSLYSISGTTLKTKVVFDYEAKAIHSIRVRVTDRGGLWFETVLAIQVIDVNETPSNILLSRDRVSEKLPIGTQVGILSAVDPDAGDAHAFELVSGSGDSGNAAFIIAGSALVTNAVFDVEEKNSYSIRVRTADREGLVFEKAITIRIMPYNQPPTDISLSASSVAENRPVGTIVGSFNTTDPNEDDTFLYALVSGDGADHNALFAITGSSLQTAAVFDFEQRSSCNIRVRSTDSGGLFIEKAFTILISDVNEHPTAVILSNATVKENQPAGTTIGDFSATDPDAGDSHRFTLVSGSGSADNPAFKINGSLLQTNTVFDFEKRSTYTLRVRATDAGGLFVEAPFTITILDINDAPSGLELIGNEIPENNQIGDLIGVFSAQDQDTWDSHTYHLISGAGSSGNGAFSIAGDRLLAAASFDYETQTAYSIRVRVVDQGGLWFERVFTVDILPVNEYPPTAITLSSASIPEHRSPGSGVGWLKAIDADHGDWHTSN
jgi:murein DD-endopeptidase MepM/ murein hydrolase activator NlpD